MCVGACAWVRFCVCGGLPETIRPSTLRLPEKMPAFPRVGGDAGEQRQRRDDKKRPRGDEEEGGGGGRRRGDDDSRFGLVF